jgi:hypothetical protein
LYLGEFCSGVIESLRCTGNDYFLALQAVEKNLRSLRSNRCGLQIVVQLSNLPEQSLQSL